jgi:tetratricopeptide (TPR) repeat protein
MIARHHVAALVVATAAVSTFSGCASGGPISVASCVPPVGLQGVADSSVRDGCYTCLLKARDDYERLLGDCNSSDLLVRLFETQLLVALRERELAIDEKASIRVAEQLAARLPATANASRYLGMVAAIRPDFEGMGNSPVARASEEGIRAELAWLTRSPSSNLLDEYLRVALECELQDTALPDANAAAVPLLQYRQALCGTAVNVPAMHQVRGRVPEFYEAVVFSARALASPELGLDHGETLRLLTLAQERLPRSTTVAYQLAVVANAAGQCERAERHYSEALSLRPAHQGARLGRAICLSQLGRYEEAIADASVIIDADGRSSGEALYWRAWSRYRTQSVSEARADVDKAKQTHRTPTTLMLAGLIEMDQSDLGLAHDDLQEAVSSSPAYCQARWQLGVVDFRRQDFEASAETFAAAASCYADAMLSNRNSLAAVLARTDMDNEFRARRVSALEAEGRELERGHDSAALNAALNYARAGNRERGTAYLRQASPNAPRDAVEDVARVLGVEMPSTNPPK